MKTILFVDNSIRCFYLFRLCVAKSFIEHGFKVYVLTPDKDFFYIKKIEEVGVEYISYTNSNGFSPFKDLKLFFSFYNLYRKISPDYVIHYTIKPNIYGTLAAKLSSIPSFSVVPGTGSVFQKKGLFSKIVLLLYKFSFKFPIKVWVLNKDDYQAFIEGKIINSDRLDMLPSEGVNTAFYSPRTDYMRNSPFIFLYMGRMLREKGVENIANASRLLKERGCSHYEIHLLGLMDGQSKDIISHEEIKKWESEGLVKYLGSVHDVRDNIDNSDCILLPTFYGEGVPRSLIEANSMERIIITTDNVGCREVVDNNYNGFLCKPRSIEDLTDKMEYVLKLEPNVIKQMGKNGRKKMMNVYDESIVIQKYLKEIIK